MERIWMIVGSIALAAGISLNAFAQEGHHAAGEGTPVTVIGELVDTACFVHSGGDAVGQGHAECARACLASGIPAGVLPHGSEDHTAMQILLTNPVPLAEHAAKVVRVEGNVYEGMERFIEPKQVFVQDGDTWREVQLEDEHNKPGADRGHGEGHGHGERGGHGERQGHGANQEPAGHNH
jgi:hypothetical protein